ncbi:MAG: CRISPR-associated protein Cas4 [bacterium]|nr:CRISPR-associated protein Cas4 [bacterium]
MVTGTMMNYYFHCKRQCYLFANRLNLEDNSEQVKNGKAMHEEKAEHHKNTEIQIEQVKIDGLTNEYVVEYKKSDADVTACKWQVLLYLWELKKKGIIRKGRIEFIEKKKEIHKIEYVELTDDLEEQLKRYIEEIEALSSKSQIPEVLHKASCKKCAYYEYCYI